MAIESCYSLPHPPPFGPGPPPNRNIFTDIVQNVANGFLAGFLGNGHGNGIRPGGYNFPPNTIRPFPPNTRPGYGEYFDNGVNNVGVNIPGQSFGINDHRGPQQGGFNGNGNGYNTGLGQGGNNGEVPAQNTAATIRPQKPDINGEKDKGDAAVNNYFIVVPLNPNEIKPQQQGELNSNANGPSINDVSNNAGGENINSNVNGNAIVDAQVTNPQNNPEQHKGDANTQLNNDPDLKYNVNNPQEPKVPSQIEGNGNNQERIKDDSIENEKQGPGFNNESTNEGTLILDPEVKYNTNKPDESKQTSPDDENMIANRIPHFNDDSKNGIPVVDPESKHGSADELDKFRNPDAIVFPNEGTQIIIENLPNRFSNAESTNQPSNNVQVTQPTPVSNTAAIQTENQNQQVPANNGNAPYVNGAGNSNGAYTVVNTPTSSGSSGSSNGNAAVSSTGQSNIPYVNAVGNPNGYSVVNVPSNVGNSGQSYVIPSNDNSGTNNPSVVYVLSNGNSGVRNPSYVSPNYGTNFPSQSFGYNDVNKPNQVYIPYNGNAGGNPNQIYVLANPGDYNLGQSTPRPIYVTIPGSGVQTTNSGYYKPIYVPANNGQISVPVTYKPVVAVPGPGYQVVGNNPGVIVSYQTPGNMMTSGGSTPSPNVPLLISYKDDEKDENEQKKDKKKKAKQSDENEPEMD